MIILVLRNNSNNQIFEKEFNNIYLANKFLKNKLRYSTKLSYLGRYERI